MAFFQCGGSGGSEKHVKQPINSETGVHNLRHYDEKLQLQDEEGSWVDITSGAAGFALVSTLESGETSLIIEDERITSDSKLYAVYTSIFGVALFSATFNEGSVTLVFPEQTEDMTVRVLFNSDSTNGTAGADGKSAYQYAQDGGYEGTEEEFAQLLGSLGENKGSGSGVLPLNVVNPSISCGNTSLTVSWEDPEDTTIDGTVMAEWQGTKLVYKLGAYPTSITDGVLAVDNQVKDQYKDNGFTISGLTNGETYYIALFPYSTDGVVNDNEENRLSGMPLAYRTMTIKIDQTDSNPETCCTYADNAISLVYLYCHCSVSKWHTR